MLHRSYTLSLGIVEKNLILLLFMSLLVDNQRFHRLGVDQALRSFALVTFVADIVVITFIGNVIVVLTFVGKVVG